MMSPVQRWAPSKKPTMSSCYQIQTIVHHFTLVPTVNHYCSSAKTVSCSIQYWRYAIGRTMSNVAARRLHLGCPSKYQTNKTNEWSKQSISHFQMIYSFSFACENKCRSEYSLCALFDSVEIVWWGFSRRHYPQGRLPLQHSVEKSWNCLRWCTAFGPHRKSNRRHILADAVFGRHTSNIDDCLLDGREWSTPPLPLDPFRGNGMHQPVRWSHSRRLLRKCTGRNVCWSGNLRRNGMSPICCHCKCSIWNVEIPVKSPETH